MKFSISLAAFALLASSSAAQQVMWKDNPITGKVVGLTYGTSGWNAAEAQAVAYGGHLVTVRSQQENQWLKDEFASVWAAPSTLGPWIGLNDVASEGSWAWSSGEAPTQPFLGFVSPEPNGGTLENWVHWQPYSGWSWNDVDEGRANKALIEVQRRPESSWSWSKRISLGTGLYHQSAIDFDADGDMDLAVQDHGHGNVWLLENDGTGTCTVRAQLTTVPWPMNSIGHDWDRDGRLDILVTSSCYSWQGGNVYLLRQNASGSFENAVAVLTASEPWDILAADVSGDGNVDMVVSSFAPNSPLRIYVANAAGSLPSMPTTVVQTNFPDQLFVSGADLDGDFDIDLVVGGNQQFAVLPNGGGGVFGAPMVFGGACARPLMCDVDGDGDADIVQVRSSPASIVVWRNLGALQFVSDPAIALQVDPTTADFADFDLDGDWDLVAGSLYADRLDVFHNNGLGVFVSKAVLLENSYAVGVLCADMNNDRKMDITAVNHYGQNVAIILNQAFQDCDANGVDDYGSIANGTAPDCNVNGRPDSCDFALGLDSDGNGILDGCEPTLVSLSPAMRPAFTAGVVSVATTNVPDGTATLTLSSPGFGQPIVRTFAIANNAGSVTLPALGGPSASDVVASGTISFTDALGNTVVTDVTPDVFTWDVPRIVAASPSNAPFDQTTGVVFTLEDHVATSGFGTAKFGNSPAQSAFLFTSAGQRWVSTIAPAQPAPGPVDVLLQFGNEFTLAQRGFVFLGPGVTNLSATSGWQAGGEALDVELYGFAPNVPVDVIFGSGAGAVSVAAVPNGVAAQSFLSLTTPYVPLAGALDFTVVQNAGLPSEKRVVSPGAWLAEAPRIASVSPGSGFQGGGDLVTLTLEGFPAGVATRVELGSQVYNVTNSGTLDLSTASLTTTLAPIAGPVDVTVRQGLGGPTPLDATLAAGFNFVGPSLLGIQPTSGPLEGGTQVVAKTAGFDPSQPAQVQLGGTTLIGTVTGVGASQTVSFRTKLATASGLSDVTLSQGVLVATLPGGFTFDPPRVTTYCQAKLTSAGLLPVIGFTGSPSASTGDFAITLSNALPNKVGLYFHGAIATAPFQSFYGGKLCVQPPTQRGPAIQTDANGFASSPFVVTPAMVGTDRAIQWWFRDPADANTVGLSRGLKVLGFYP